jgi:hypothetical protein
MCDHVTGKGKKCSKIFFVGMQAGSMLPDCRIAVLQNCIIAELQYCSIAELQYCRIAVLQN